MKFTTQQLLLFYDPA